jgi:hypothetical protein
VVPCESTFRRTLQHLDADALDNTVGGWAQQRTASALGRRRMIAVDGKTLRGSGTADGAGRHLLAALDNDYGVVLGQADVEAKTNEIPMFATVMDRIDRQEQQEIVHRDGLCDHLADRPPTRGQPNWPGSCAVTGSLKTGCTGSRDVTFGEDSATSRTGRGPVNLATIRAAIIAAIKDGGYLHISKGRCDHTIPAEALRPHGLD